MPTTAFWRPSSSRHDALGLLSSGVGGPIGTPCGGHEIAEQTAGVVAPLVALAFQRAVDLGGDGKPHLAAEHHGVFGGQAVQPDDVAVEPAGDHQRRFKHRPGIAVADHGQQILHGPTLLRVMPARLRGTV